MCLCVYIYEKFHKNISKISEVVAEKLEIRLTIWRTENPVLHSLKNIKLSQKISIY